jgi:hypothetical protein
VGRVRLSHPLFSGPSPRAPVFDFRAHFCHSGPWKRTLSASDSGPQRPGGPKSISYQSRLAIPHPAERPAGGVRPAWRHRGDEKLAPYRPAHNPYSLELHSVIQAC